MNDPKKVEIISLNEEDAIDMIVDQTAVKRQCSNDERLMTIFEWKGRSSNG